MNQNKFEIAEAKERIALDELAPRIGCKVVYTTPIGSYKHYDAVLDCAKHTWKVEIKLRNRKTSDFDDCIFEKYKYDELINPTYGEHNEFKADKSMFIVKYNDLIHFWEITANNAPEWQDNNLTATSVDGDDKRKWKQVTYLPFTSTFFNISTKK
jgi:hypothetical protein